MSNSNEKFLQKKFNFFFEKKKCSNIGNKVRTTNYFCLKIIDSNKLI